MSRNSFHDYSVQVNGTANPHLLNNMTFPVQVQVEQAEQDDVMLERGMLGTPIEQRLYSPQLEDYISRPSSPHSDDGDANLSHISVESVQFKKDAQVVKTIHIRDQGARPARHTVVKDKGGGSKPLGAALLHSVNVTDRGGAPFAQGLPLFCLKQTNLTVEQHNH